MKLFFFNLINIAQAHEEGATSLTVENSLGPVLMVVIIFLAVVIGKYITKRKLDTNIQMNTNDTNLGGSAPSK